VFLGCVCIATPQPTSWCATAVYASFVSKAGAGESRTDTVGHVVDRKTFDLMKQKHGAHAGWAVWSEPTAGPKSNVGDLDVLDPDRNPTLLQTLRNDVVMLGLNLARETPPAGSLRNFHDRSSKGQDYKIRYAFSGTPYWGAYMTDLIKKIVELKSRNVMREVRADPSLMPENVQWLLEEFDDLQCASPIVIAFGIQAYRLAIRDIPSNRYTRLVGVRHYSDYISKEDYRARVLAELGT